MLQDLHLAVYSAMFSAASLMNWVTALSGASDAEIPILSRTVAGVTLANFKPHRFCGDF